MSTTPSTTTKTKHASSSNASNLALATGESNNNKIASQFEAAVPQKPVKFRSACDNCHKSKVRCSGGATCMRCKEFATSCIYSSSARTGKPKGSRSRKTIEREKRAAALDASRSSVEAVSVEPAGLDALPDAETSANVVGMTSSEGDIDASRGTLDSENTWALSMSRLISEPLRDVEDHHHHGGVAVTAGPSRSSSSGPSMSWTMNDCDGINFNQALGISSATFWDNNTIWPTDELGALDHNASTTTTTTTTTTCSSGIDSLELQRLQPIGSSTDACQCLITIAELVPSLTCLVSDMSAKHTDRFLLLVRQTCATCDMYRRCTQCIKDATAISLTSTVLQLVVWLAGKLGVGGPESTTTELNLQLGTYHVCDGDEQQMLVRALVSCRLRKLVTAAHGLRDAVERLTASTEREDQTASSSPDSGVDMDLAPQLSCFDQSLSQLQACQEGVESLG